MRIARRVDGRWAIHSTVLTNEAGRYETVVRDATTRYRATVLRSEVITDEHDWYICRKSFRAKPHRHRR